MPCLRGLYNANTILDYRPKNPAFHVKSALNTSPKTCIFDSIASPQLNCSWHLQTDNTSKNQLFAS